MVYTVPAELYPLSFVRYASGFLFVSYIPGYCLLKLLFAKKNELDILEGFVLSISLSFCVVALLGLSLGLTPIGINFGSVTISLGLIVVFLALFALIRERL